MRLNPFAPKDDPMYESLFCFGGGDDGGGGGGGGGGGSTTDDAYDSGNQQTGQGSRGSGGEGGGGGGSADDADSMDSGYDTSTVGMGTNTMGGGGGGGGGGGSGFYVDPIGTPTYPDVSDFGKKQTEAEAAAAKAGVPSDVFVTSAGGNIVRSKDGTPVTSSRSVQEAAKAAGTSTSSVMDAIKGAAGTDFGEGFGVAPGPGTSDQGPQGTAVTQAALEPAKVEAARQVTPQATPGLTPEVAKIASGILDQAVPGRAVTGVRADPVMGGSLFMDDIDVFAPEVTSVNAPPSAKDPSQPMVSIRGATPADMITAEARAAANARFGPTGMQPTTTEVDAYNQAINEQIADQLGISSYSPSTYGATGPLSQISTGPITQQDYDNLAAGRGVMQGGIASVNQMVDQAMREVELETGVPASEMQGIIASNIGGAGMSTRPSGTPGVSVANIGGVDYTFDGTVPADQRTYTQATPTQSAANQQQLDAASGAATGILDSYDRMMAEQRAVANRDQMAAEMAADQGTFDPRISAGVMSDSPQQFDLEQMQLANDLIARSTPAANRTPVTLDRAMQKDREGYFSPSEYEIAAQGPLDTTDFDRAVAEEESRAAAQGPVDYTGAGSLNYAPGTAAQETVPGFGESVDRAIADFADRAISGGYEFDEEGNVVPTEQFGMTRSNLVEQPTEYLSGYSPAEQYEMQEGLRSQYGMDLSEVGVPSSVDVFGAKIPTGTGVVEGVVNALFNPSYSLSQALQAGAKPVYSSDGTRVVGATSPDGSIVYADDPYGDILAGIKGTFGYGEGIDPNMKAAYDRAREIQDAEREMQGGDGGGQMLPPVEKPPEDVPPEEYKGRDVVKPYQYQARGPLSYSYTGLPSLAPTRLRPSYQAPKRFSPLFPVS